VNALHVAASPDPAAHLLVTCDCGHSCFLVLVPTRPDGSEIPAGGVAFIAAQTVRYQCDGCGSETALQLVPTGGGEWTRPTLN